MSNPQFLTTLDVRAMPTPDEWVLLAPLRYQPATGRPVTVPAGFVTDLASIPRPARALVSPNGTSRRAAVLHDWLYCLRAGARAEADALFLEALEADGVGWFTRRVMWLAVRAGGWVYWGRRADGLTGDDFTDIGS